MFMRPAGFFLLAAVGLAALARPAAAQTMLPVQDPANGHWYQAVRVAGAITWTDAKAAAQSLTYAGFPGHLVTITSADENQFIINNLLSRYPDVPQWWLGGYQDTSAPDYVEPAGGWRWVTGEPWSYTAWYPGEPNNYGGNEDALEFHQAKGWNDFPRGSGLGGYIVEYEPLPIATGPLLSFQPNPVVGGQPAVGQVILAQPAGPGGVVVSLASSDPTAAVVPAVVTVPTGANTLAFPVVTFPVAAAVTVTITATYAGGTGAGTLQLLAGAAPVSPPGAGAPGAPSPVYNPANGHWYQAVPAAGGISWPQARDAAAALSYAGYPGHLVTITSMDENGFVDSYLPLSGTDEWWTGAYQDRSAPDYSEPAGGWRWLTGEPWSFTFWGQGQPDNFQGDQDNMDVDTRFGDHWDDRYEADRVGGYIVEYEPQPVPPPVPAVPPAGAAQLALFPNPVPGGLLALGQVILPQPAGAGGQAVSLSSDNPAVAVTPAALTVPPGASSVTFPIVTFPVAAPASVLISANSAFGSATATLFILPLSSPIPQPSAANLLANGSFEAPRITDGSSNWNLHDGSLPGWRITQGDVDVVQSWEPAPGQGLQSLDLAGDHPGTIEQTFPTVPGQLYRFSGWLAHNNGSPYGRANVYLNGVFLTQLYHDIPSSDQVMHWEPFAFLFAATAPATTLTLMDVTGLDPRRGTALDGLAVTLASIPSPPVVQPAADLPAPSSLAARLQPGQAVALTWTDNSTDENAFAIWRKTPTADWARVGLTAPNKTTFLDPALAPGTTYTYRVRATRGNTPSDWSNEVTVTPAAGA